MRITTINDDATLDELIDRVQGAGAAKNQSVRQQFMDLNPHLADFDNLPAGTPVVLPDDSIAAPAPDPRTQVALSQTQQALTSIRADLDAGTARSAVTAATTTEILNDPKVAEAVRTNGDIEKYRTGVLQALKDEETEWTAQRATIDGALAGFEETLKNFTPPEDGGVTPPPVTPPPGRRRAVAK
jgi:phage tail protein X